MTTAEQSYTSKKGVIQTDKAGLKVDNFSASAQ